MTGDAQFVCEARRFARLIERTGTPTYLYSYEYEIDALSLDHVIHGVESNILFGNNYVPRFPELHAPSSRRRASRLDERLLDTVRRHRQSQH